MTLRFLAPLFLSSLVLHAQHTAPSPIPEKVRTEFKLSPFYKQHLLVEGFPSWPPKKSTPKALQETAAIMRKMLKNRPDIFRALAKNKVRYSIMAVSERTCDIPSTPTSPRPNTGTAAPADSVPPRNALRFLRRGKPPPPPR